MKALGTVKVVTAKNADEFKRLGFSTIELIKRSKEGHDMHLLASYGNTALITFVKMPPEYKAPRYER